MAIKIDVPGIGEITVEGIAQEETMQQILEQVKTSEKSKRKKEADAEKATKELEKSAKRATESLDGMIDAEEEAAKKSAKRTEEFSNSMKQATGDLTKSLTSFAGTLASTATVVAASMVKNIDENAANPIKFGAQIINTGIDLMSSALKIGVDAVSAFGSGLLGMVPVVGGGLSKLADGLSEAAKAAIDMGSALLKAGNEFMAAEFEKTVKSMRDLSKVGASFGGGMTQLRQIANESGVGISTFTQVIKDSQNSVHQFGMSSTESTTLLSDGMKKLAGTFKTVNGVQITARDQLLNLGYTFEEQGPILAQFMNQAKMAGRNLAAMTPKELTDGVAQYAVNLKAISDITGQDAKKLMEKAQAETMRGALMGKLDEKQQKAFQEAYSTLAAVPGSLGPKLQTGLEQLLSGGAVTDPVVAGNENLMKSLQQSADAVRSGNQNMIADTQRNLSEAAKANRNNALNQSADYAALHGVNSGLVKEISDANNSLNAYSMSSSDAGKVAVDTAKNQLSTTDKVSLGFDKASVAVTNFQVSMETLATDMMPKYADAMRYSTEQVTKMVMKTMEMFKALADGKSLQEALKAGQEDTNKPAEAKTEPSESGSAAVKAYDSKIAAKEAELEKLQKKENLSWFGKTTGLHDTTEIKKAKEELDNLKTEQNRLSYMRDDLQSAQEQALRDATAKATEKKYGGKWGAMGHADVALTPQERAAALKAANDAFAKKYSSNAEQVDAILKATQIVESNKVASTFTTPGTAGTAGPTGTGRTVEIQNPMGELEKRSGGDRNWRNNNPGNIEYGDFAVRHGAIGSDGRFAIFPDAEMGRKAQDALMLVKSKQGKSIRDAVKSWAPESENDTATYLKRIENAGIDLSKQYADLSAEDKGKLLDVQTKIEGGRAGTVEKGGVAQAQPTKPTVATADTAKKPSESEQKVQAELKGITDEQIKAYPTFKQHLADAMAYSGKAEADAIAEAAMEVKNDMAKDLQKKYALADNKVKALAEGGKVAKGQFAIAGEKGPEIVKGPADVTSKDLTQKMIVALDALREMKGQRFGANDFQAQVGMNEDRWRVLEERIAPMQKPGQNLDELRLELEAKMKERDNANPEYRKAMDYMMKDEGPSDHEKRTVQHLNDHTSILNQILNTLQHGNKLQSGILQNSY